MELTLKQVLESEDYIKLKEKIGKERNWGDPHDRYLADFSVFQKDAAEKSRTYNLKMEWRARIKRAGFTKRGYKGEPID